MTLKGKAGQAQAVASTQVWAMRSQLKAKSVIVDGRV